MQPIVYINRLQGIVYHFNLLICLPYLLLDKKASLIFWMQKPKLPVRFFGIKFFFFFIVQHNRTNCIIIIELLSNISFRLSLPLPHLSFNAIPLHHRISPPPSPLPPYTHTHTHTHIPNLMENDDIEWIFILNLHQKAQIFIQMDFYNVSIINGNPASFCRICLTKANQSMN